MGHPHLCVTFSICPSICLSIHRIPYRRNHTSSNHNFWYIHVCKMISLSVFFFFIFLKFLFFGLLGGRGKGKNSPIWKKNNIRHTPYLRNSSIRSWVLVHLCKMMISPDVFLIFLKFSFFGLLGGWKGEKMSKMKNNSYICHVPYDKNDPRWQKKISLLQLISQEPYIIWLSFMMHLRKMMISLGFFSFFQNFDSLGC